MKKTKKPKGENDLTLKRALENDLLALKTVHKAAPLYLPTYFYGRSSARSSTSSSIPGCSARWSTAIRRANH